jgi:hypothetical protein
MKPTYLYIKRHTLTNLKYFGKTYKNNPEIYLGSGKYWLRHIKKHGIQHVETVWYQLFTDETEMVEYATKFSTDNNIVESIEWANLKLENGLDGGFDAGKWTPEQIKHFSNKTKEGWAKGKYDPEKLRLSRIGFKQPQSQKESVAKALSKTWHITYPNGDIKIITNLNKFCRENNLDQGNLSRGLTHGFRAKKLSE